MSTNKLRWSQNRSFLLMGIKIRVRNGYSLTKWVRWRPKRAMQKRKTIPGAAVSSQALASIWETHGVLKKSRSCLHVSILSSNIWPDFKFAYRISITWLRCQEDTRRPPSGRIHSSKANQRRQFLRRGKSLFSLAWSAHDFTSSAFYQFRTQKLIFINLSDLFPYYF